MYEMVPPFDLKEKSFLVVVDDSLTEIMPISIHNADYLRRAVISHQSKVKSLYKRACRLLESWDMPYRSEYLVNRPLLRQRFEDNRGLKDLRIAKILLLEGEEELFMNQHPKPMKFTYSPGGICYERYHDHPDQILDLWHPLEKASYPYYFARREQRKLEYIKLWESKHGVPSEEDCGVTKYRDYNTEPETEEQKKYGPFNVTVAKTIAEFGKPAEKIYDEKQDEIIHKKHDHHH